MGEIVLAAIYCTLIALGGQPEATHHYSAGGNPHKIRVDCETPSEVIEVGLDKRSSLDSIQQALFAAHLTGKRPVVLIINSDGCTREYETRIRAAARMAGVRYISIHRDSLIRWRMTHWLRNRRTTDPIRALIPETVHTPPRTGDTVIDIMLVHGVKNCPHAAAHR